MIVMKNLERDAKKRLKAALQSTHVYATTHNWRDGYQWHQIKNVRIHRGMVEGQTLAGEWFVIYNWEQR